jgi:DNA-damage-inducible protein D
VEAFMAEEYEHYVTRMEGLRRTTPYGAEVWLARDLQPVLAYDTWENFEKVVLKARVACESAGVRVDHHFLETTKMIVIGKGGERSVTDYYLSRYACYLLGMSADGSKAEVAFALTYFAKKTREKEIEDQRSLIAERVELRDRLRDANKDLARAAKAAGVRRFGIFQDEGYRGLYGGRGLKQIKAEKNLDQKEDLIDRMGRAELFANGFRVTQADEKIKNEGITGEENAFKAHREVGREVRATIARVGGTMPEKLPPADSLKKLTAAEKKALKAKRKGITDGQ